MKRLLLWVITLCLAVTLLGCQKVMKGTDELIEKAREELPVADAENMDVAYAGQCVKDGYALLWFISGNEYQAHTYLPMECEVVGEDGYTFAHVYNPYDAGKDIVTLLWQRGYAFLVNNPACTTIRLTDANGTWDVAIDKDAYPFVYYTEQLPSEFLFLDAQGQEIQ